MTVLKQISLIFLLITTILAKCFSQQYNFRYISIDNGLAQSQVFSLFQDHKGYLWIGTYGGGLNRFDGLKMSLFTVADGLSSNDIRVIFEDSKTNLWIGTYKGLCLLKGKTFVPIHKETISVISMAEDKDGIIWIGTEKDGLYFIKNKVLQKYSLSTEFDRKSVCSILCANDKIYLALHSHGLGIIHNGKSSIYQLQEAGVTSLTIDNKNNIWAGTTNGLYSFNENEINKFTKGFDIPDHITSLLTDHKNSIWATTWGTGIIRIQDSTVSRFSEGSGLKGSYYNSIYEDKAGNICIGSDGDGLCIYESERFRYLNTQTGLPGNTIMALYQDNNGVYWFGSYGKGICSYDGEKFRYFTKKDGLCDDIIYAIAGDKNNNLWIGSKSGGVSCYNGKSFKNYSEADGLCSNEATSIVCDNNGNIWIGSKLNGVSCFNGEKFINLNSGNGLSSDKVVTVFADHRNNIWLGTQEGIINKITFRNNEKPKDANSFSIKIFFDNPLLSKINAIAQGSDGLLWFGSQENGIYSYNGHIFKNFNTKKGLNSDFIYSIIYDNVNNMWLGTSKGADKLTFSDKSYAPSVTNYGLKEGFTGIENNIHAALKDNKGRLLFGTVNGIMIYDPAFDVPDTLKPEPMITDLLLFYKGTDWTKYSEYTDSTTMLPVGLKLPYNKNYLTFKFIGIDITNAQSIKYKWKLEGYDEDWTPLMSHSEASYTNLPPGTYTFQIKAYNSSNLSNEKIAQFTFEIVPPFWNRWSFRIILAVIIIIVVFYYFKQKEWNLRKDKLKLEKTVRERTEEILIQKTELFHKTEELSQKNIQLEKLSIVARETDNAIVIMNAECIVEWVNEGFLRMYEYSENDLEKLIGKSIYEISSNPDISNIIEFCRTEKQSAVYDVPTKTNSGKTIWTHTTLTPIFDSQDSIIKMVSIDSDISQRIEVQENLELEKAKTENLLLNILPSITAQELKEKGYATPKFYKSASIAFTDFKGFTLLCEQISPLELIEQLHSYFASFDDIIEKYNIEKIKTIGDSYMFASGLPQHTPSHPIKIVLASLEIQRFMLIRNNLKKAQGKQEWKLRIGVHSGEVITGVVGKKKFAYDVWGDTVNVASRMESAGIADGVNISEQTYELIKDYFVCEHRGEIDVKHKDKINMYLVKSIKPEYASDEKGIEPNELFQKIINATV